MSRALLTFSREIPKLYLESLTQNSHKHKFKGFSCQMLCLMGKCWCSHRNRCSSCHSWGIHSAINPPAGPAQRQSLTNATKKKLWENSHVLPAPGVYPVVVNECLNVNTNSSISTINKENLPLQRRRKIVCFFSFGVVWLADFYCLFFFPPGQWLPPWQTFSKSLAKQQQWLNFPWSALRSGLFCPIRNKFGVREESQVFLSSLP